jgi:hypothetical protein
MRKRLQLILGLSDERGATAIIIGLLMVVFIGIAAVVVDIGYAMATKNELQNISDGAALAATGWLGDKYSDMSTAELLIYEVDGTDEADIKGIAKDVADQNRAGGVGNIIINDVDIEIGQWDSSIEADDIDDSVRGTVNDPRFTPTLEQPDAVRVITRREEDTNGPVSTFFARIFGQDVVSINTIATAALTGIDRIDECELFWPVGISAAWFKYWNEQTGNFCDQDIKMYPTGGMEGCAGWHTFDSWPPNASKLAKILNDKKNGDCSPETGNGDELAYIGGTVSAVFDEMKALFDWGRVQDEGPDGTIDLDTNPLTWTTHVVIYGWDDCSNPTGDIPIVGFATVEINQILEAPDKIISATVKCLEYTDGRGGGNYGTRGMIPGLVQ